MPKQGRSLSCEELISYWDDLSRRYPVVSIEDPFGEGGLALLAGADPPHRRPGSAGGDDLFVTNPGRIRQGIQKKAANAALIKPNQIGTLTETLEAVSIAQNAGYRAVISHRSGDGGQLYRRFGGGDSRWADQSGRPCRSDRTAKYNRLLRIEGAPGPPLPATPGGVVFACLATAAVNLWDNKPPGGMPPGGLRFILYSTGSPIGYSSLEEEPCGRRNLFRGS